MPFRGVKLGESDVGGVSCGEQWGGFTRRRKSRMFIFPPELKRVFLYMALGTIFSMSGHLIVFVLWEPYPQISMVLFPISVLAAAVFGCMAAFEVFKYFKED
jgi:hypothetical protein